MHDFVAATISGIAEIRDNWFALRADFDGRLLMVGPYLPAPAEGVAAVRVEQDAVPALLEELRARLGAPPQVIELRGTV